MKILSIDLGDARTGIAVSDVFETIASPVKVIKCDYIPKIITQISEICKEITPELIVVGNPVNMDGSRGERSQKCVAFAEELEKTVKIKTVTFDERLTTVESHKILNTANVRGQKRKDVVDAVAATLILEDYMLYKKNKKD